MADLDDVIAHYGKPDFEAMLTEALEADPSALPLDEACDGGFPDDENGVKCSVLGIEDANGQVTVRIQCFFTEARPTGCSDIQTHHKGVVDFKVFLDLSEGTVIIDDGSYG